jgi:putative hydrolase of the HAD superfamily
MQHGRRLAALAALCNSTDAELDAAIWASGLDDEFDRGKYSREGILALFRQRFGFRGDADALARAWVAGFAPDPALLAVVDDIRPGTLLVILSDNGPVLRAALPSLLPEVGRRFQHIFFSCETGELKPASRMFTTVSRALERRPERLLFFDDLPANVRAARELGWHASVYTDPPAAAAILAEAGLLEAHTRR